MKSMHCVIVTLCVAAMAAHGDSGALANVHADGVMLGGSDPVELARGGGVKPGSASIESVHQYGTYRFVSADNRQAFDRQPDGFAPQYGGFCPVSLAEGELEPGDPSHAVVSGGKLYVLKDASHHERWKAGEADVIRDADANWPAMVKARGTTLGEGQVTAGREITLDAARAVIAAGRAYAIAHRSPGGSIAVTDSGGHLVCMERLDNTFAASASVACEKARTAALFRFPSKKLEDSLNGGRPALETVGFNMLRGGIPLFYGGEVVGAIGVSGAASALQDEQIALAGSRATFE